MSIHRVRMSRTPPATGDPVLLWPAFAPQSKTSSRGGIVEDVSVLEGHDRNKATDNCVTVGIHHVVARHTPEPENTVADARCF